MLYSEGRKDSEKNIFELTISISIFVFGLDNHKQRYCVIINNIPATNR